MFELGLEPLTLVILATVGLLAGFIDAIAGGGGLMTIPALLTAGLPPHLALGTNKLAASFGSCTASITFYRKRLFDPVFWKRSFGATAIGAILGTLAVDMIDTDQLERLLPLVVFAVAIYTLLQKPRHHDNHTLPERTPGLFRRQWSQGITLGFYDGVAGPGTGAFWTVSSMVLYRLEILLASGLARSMNFVSNFMSLLTFMWLGHINYWVGLVMGVSIMLGAYIGAHSAIRFGSKFIRPVFISVVLIMATRLAWNAWLS